MLSGRTTVAALLSETGGRGLFQFIGADGVGPGKSGNEAGFPGNEAEGDARRFLVCMERRLRCMSNPAKSASQA